ncbi:hypothetical protein VNO77_05141 [Canavalia gladiata]|uniref:Uncharacterized protein n=1 Tax=Canavalia gladiata TaxID=3824 RepID=A0AAN9N2X5_CANGL
MSNLLSCWFRDPKSSRTCSSFLKSIRYLSGHKPGIRRLAELGYQSGHELPSPSFQPAFRLESRLIALSKTTRLGSIYKPLNCIASYNVKLLVRPDLDLPKL